MPGAYRVLVGRSEGQRLFGTSRNRQKDNVKMDLQEVGRGAIDWVDLAQERDRWQKFVNAGMYLWFRYNVGNFLTS
jgi:hypothetical protein